MAASLRRRTKILLVSAGVLLVAAIVAAALAIKPLLRAYATQEARKYGVELTISNVELGLSHVRIRGAQFELIGVQTIAGTLQTMDIDVEGLTPVRFEAAGLNIGVTGSVATLALELGAWTKNYPQIYRLPLKGREVNVRWRSGQDRDPWLEIDHGTVVPNQTGGTFVAEHAKVLGLPVGKVGSSWSGEESVVSLGLGKPDLAAAPVTARVHHAKERPSAEIALAATPIADLSGAFGVDLGLPQVLASGTANIDFAKIGGAETSSGKLAIKLKGFVPPHPRELDGFVFGDVTTFETNFDTNEDYTAFGLHDARVTAGAFVLTGTGKVERLVDHGHVLLDLKGNLQCAALASANIQSQLGKTIGPLLARAARNALTGKVNIAIKIDADSRDLAHAKLERTVGIGCGLKPLTLPDGTALPKIELPPLPSSLPPLPSALPRLPLPF